MVVGSVTATAEMKKNNKRLENLYSSKNSKSAYKERTLTKATGSSKIYFSVNKLNDTSMTLSNIFLYTVVI